jgi:hypothetical protein
MVTLIVAAAWGLYLGDWINVFMSLATLGLMAFSIHLSTKMDFYFPRSFITVAVIFIYATLFLGEIANFYEKYWWWDVLLHMGSAVGFGLVGFTLLILLFRSKRITASPILLCLFGFSFAVALGALWEIWEFALDQLFDLNTQKSGLMDTMWDLIINAIGGLISAVAGYFYLVRPEPNNALTAMIDEMVDENVKTNEKK